jgi:hypothetical protein
VRRRVSDRFVLAAFVVLAISSLGLKAAAGSPHDGLMDVASDQVDKRLEATLRAQQFAISEQTFAHRSSLIVATRGACELGVRDARDGVAVATAFARDAAEIGSVRYLYRGRSYGQPPAFAMRLGRIETEAKSRLGLSAQAPIPVALAASPACGSGDYGFANVQI